MSETTTALAPVAADALSAPLPTYSGAAMAQALAAYRDLQRALDREMPDQIQRIGDKDFRKKGFWRGVNIAFDLSVELVEERYEERGTFDDGRPNFGYLVTYRASTRTGRSMIGDGSCFAVEKADRFRCPHPHPSWQGKSEHYPPETCPDYDEGYRWHALSEQASEHNVRAHAHTRAKNRAISDLVAFGEVSAEEVERTYEPDERAPASAPRRTSPPPTRPAPSSRGTQRISEGQVKRFWAIANQYGWSRDKVDDLLARHGFEHADHVTRDRYESLCDDLQGGVERSGETS